MTEPCLRGRSWWPQRRPSGQHHPPGKPGRKWQFVPSAQATQIANLPAVAVLFAAFLGVNPIQELLGPNLSALSEQQQAHLTGLDFFPQLISGPFADGLAMAFAFAIVACVIGGIASLLTGPQKKPTPDEPHESVGAELAGIAGEAGIGPSELVHDRQ